MAGEIEGDGQQEAGPPYSTKRWELIQRASRSWSGELVDLSGRNNLLYYRDLRAGTLSLDGCPRQFVIDLLAGRATLLSKFFPEEEAQADALKRARTVRNKGQTQYEERGLETLYLAVGMASWSGQKSQSTPAAPLLLVPIRLAPRGAAQEEFELSVTGELEVNPTFLQYLKAEFEIACDPEDLLASGGIEGAIDTPEELEVSFEWLREQCRSVPDFEVSERFVVGNFSYAKMPMVRDLEGSLEAMAEHELISALAGDPEAQEALRAAGADAQIPHPDHTPPEDEYLVLDADSSQNYAINAVLAGRNLIVKGPPGTGKSQTISNLISALVARGKTVLFVAEKRAAIEAVIKRLDGVGLGDLVLDLHGGVASRRQTAQALAAALRTNAELRKPELGEVHSKLELRRSQLCERVEALHGSREPWGLSTFQIECHLLGLPADAETEVRFRGAALEALGKAVMEQAEENLSEFVGRGGFQIPRSQSPWAGATVVSSEEALSLQRRVESLRGELAALTDRLAGAASETGLRAPTTFAEAEAMLALWERSEQCAAILSAEVFDLDLDQILARCEAMAGTALARASATLTDGDYRRARNELRDRVREGVGTDSLGLFRAASQASVCKDRWDLFRVEAGPPRACSDLSGLRIAFDSVRERFPAISGEIGASPSDDSLAAARQLLDRLLGDVATLAKLPDLHRLRSALESAGLGPLLAELEPLDLGAQRAGEMLRFSWLTSLREHISLTDTRIGAFDGEQHQKAVDEFRAVDREHVETTAQRVRRRCAEIATRVQDADEAGAALLRAEAAKKRKHLSIRELFSTAPEVMTSLKPCWVMSPLVVSQVLPSDRPHFDVVVFDEASQVRPAEAMPAILRGRQLVVAGDERQLPPTDFFSTSNPEGDSEDSEAALLVDSSFESILDAMEPFVRSRMLQWHYRSRDERLIAFSNVHLYDRSLTTFPGVVGPDCVRHVHVQHEPGAAGSDVSSAAEVRRVVELVIEHAETRPEQTLGVIAMGIKHADRIDETLREALGERDDLEAFFDESREEPFFVKNLERVQGDERDAVILSVGYGKNEHGKLLYRFGPLNMEGGERRLNVAVTRAKERMTLVSSFTHLDMDPERTKSRGVALLRAYLEYCASNGANLGAGASEIAALNPFEIDVKKHLTLAGMELIPQFGSSGYRIDFAVKHPERPGQMVLAVECDGASYHSSPTARDRDRLRQEQLERLGWRFHRIWSQDWFNDREAQVERARAAFDAAVLGEAEVSLVAQAAASGGTAEPVAEPAKPEAAARSGPRPLVGGGQPIDTYSERELAELIGWIESDGLLRTKVELREEAIRELGYRRRGPRIVAALDAVIDLMRSAEQR